MRWFGNGADTVTDPLLRTQEDLLDAKWAFSSLVDNNSFDRAYERVHSGDPSVRGILFGQWLRRGMSGGIVFRPAPINSSGADWESDAGGRRVFFVCRGRVA